MRTLLRSPLPLGVMLAALAISSPASAAIDEPAAGPAQLDALLTVYDRTPVGAARDRLADEIDRVAGQRYATVSRLYWYQDLDAAQAAARAQHRPILHLRMLGRLDEDLSCANSRLFRTVLYANAEVSRFLRDNFVLVWSSERPVPRVTIDFGDGRTIERTTTGNSAHYVLDADGAVLDVLPGLYAPRVFQAELAKAVGLARRVRGLAPAQRLATVRAFHAKALRADRDAFAAIAGQAYIPRRGRLLAADELGEPAIARAQRATMAKAAIEIVDLARFGIDAGTIDPADVAQWAAIGQRLWGIGVPAAGARPGTRPSPAVVLDARSRALVERLYTAGPVPRPTPSQVATMIARLEQTVVADTALDELQLRPRIRTWLAATSDLAFGPLNDRIYAEVFHTPKSDPWLGLLERRDFTGLPGDGAARR